jgi:hypothetical protein
VGDRVIAEQIVPCERCRYCRSGKYWMCEVHNIFGFQREVADGGMAQYMRIPPTAIVHKIPPELPLEDAAIIEPLACAIHAVTRGDIQLDDVVVIAGAGPIGLMMVQVAKLKTPRKLVVIDMVAERLELRATLRRRCRHRSEARRCARHRARPDGRLRMRRVHRGDRQPERRDAGSRSHPQARDASSSSRFFGHDTTADWSIIGTARSSTFAARISARTATRSRSICCRVVS